MGSPTYTLIESQSLTSAANTVTIGSGGTIPQTYTDLKLVVSLRDTDTPASFYVRPNASTSNLSLVRLMADGTTITSATDTTIRVFGLNDSTTTASTFSNAELYFPNYTSSNYKSVSIDAVTNPNSSTSIFKNFVAGLWSNTAAITSIDIVCETVGTFAQYSTFYLYGIKNS